MTQILSAPARSDVDRRSLAGPATTAAPGPARPYRVPGTVITVGALMWAVAIALVGNDPQDPAGLAIFAVGSGAFQIGLFFLLSVLWRSAALGTGRLAKGFLVAESLALFVAIMSTVFDGIGLTDLSRPVFLMVDLFWPISMLGMFGLAIRIAIAGRWRGVTRFWPLVAESWAVVVIPTMMILGPGAAQVVAVEHLVIGYATLGQIVARKTR